MLNMKELESEVADEGIVTEKFGTITVTADLPGELVDELAGMAESAGTMKQARELLVKLLSVKNDEKTASDFVASLGTLAFVKVSRFVQEYVTRAIQELTKKEKPSG